MRKEGNISMLIAWFIVLFYKKFKLVSNTDQVRKTDGKKRKMRLQHIKM
jgi:hypothetical protein